MSGHAGEVVESGTRGFFAVSPAVGEAPHFGSFVRTGDGPVVYGVVTEITTESREPGRRAAAMGMPLEELRREQPQIFEVLQTGFRVLSFAYGAGAGIRFSLPPLPPQIHSFVYSCTGAEVVSLTEEDFYLRSIVTAGNAAPDELIVSSLGHAQDSRPADPDYLMRMGKSLAMIFGDDYERLSSILRRLG